MTNQRRLRTELVKTLRTLIWKENYAFPVTVTLSTPSGFVLLWEVNGLCEKQLKIPGRALATTFFSRGNVTPAGMEHSGLFPLRLTSPIEIEMRDKTGREVKLTFRSDPHQPAEVEMEGNAEDDQWARIAVTLFLCPIEDTSLAVGGMMGQEDVRIVSP